MADENQSNNNSAPEVVKNSGAAGPSVADQNGGSSKMPSRSAEERAAWQSEIFRGVAEGNQKDTGREYKSDGGFYLDEDESMDEEEASASSEDEVEIEDQDVEESESDEEHLEEESEDVTESDSIELDESECTTCMFGDQEIVVPNNATFEIKVDGELQEVTFEEIKNGISGQKAIQQRFSIINEDRKQMEQLLSNWNTNKNQFFDFMNEGKAVEALNVVFTEAGYSTDVAFATLFEELLPYYEKYAVMSDQDRMAWTEKMRAERHRLQLDTTRSELQMLQAEKEQLQRMRKVQETTGLDDGTFAELHSALKEEIANGTLSLKESDITPELIVEYGEILKQEAWIGQALSEAKLEGDNLVGAYQDIMATVNARRRRGVEMTEESVKKLVHDIYGLPAKVDKAKKVTKVLKKKGHRGTPEGRPSKVGDQSARGHGKAPKHWMDAFTNDIDTAKTPQERRERMNKWKNKK